MTYLKLRGIYLPYAAQYHLYIIQIEIASSISLNIAVVIWIEKKIKKQQKR